MQLRGLVAAAAGVCAAATAHALDVAGQLPFVHETADVRTAMSPAQVVGWLLLAAAVSALAASTRVVLVGVPGAVLVSGAPELLGRHDAGALLEPGVLVGAVVQVLLLLAVVAAALVLQRRLALLRLELPLRVVDLRPLPGRSRLPRAPARGIAAPRGPPPPVVLPT